MKLELFTICGWPSNQFTLWLIASRNLFISKKKMYQNNSKTKPGNFFRFMLMRFRSMIWLSFIFVIQFETYFATEPNFQSFQFIFSELSFWPLFRIIDDFSRSTRKSIIESREPEIIEKEQIEKCSLRKFFNC